MSRLRQVLPGVQVVATTHSPLVMLNARPVDVVSLRQRNRWVVPERVPEYSGFSADDVLRDKALFDTEPFSEVTSKKIKRYRKLAGIPTNERTKAQKREIRSLAQMVQAPVRDAETDPLLTKLKELETSLKKKGGEP